MWHIVKLAHEHVDVALIDRVVEQLATGSAQRVEHLLPDVVELGEQPPGRAALPARGDEVDVLERPGQERLVVRASSM